MVPPPHPPEVVTPLPYKKRGWGGDLNQKYNAQRQFMVNVNYLMGQNQIVRRAFIRTILNV